MFIRRDNFLKKCWVQRPNIFYTNLEYTVTDSSWLKLLVKKKKFGSNKIASDCIFFPEKHN